MSNFEKIHRVGPPKAKSNAKNSRIIVACLADVSVKDSLFKAATAYSSANNTAIKLTNQYPEELRDKRQRLFQVRDDYKKQDTGCHVRHDKLVFQNSKQVYREKVNTPKSSDILAAISDPKKCEMLDNLDTFKSEVSFISYVDLVP